MRVPATGRASIFRNKLRTCRVQAILSKDGYKAFNVARRKLAALVGWQAAKVSDADTIEYLARGHEATRVYVSWLEGQQAK
jgi:hypothetical protein